MNPPGIPGPTARSRLHPALAARARVLLAVAGAWHLVVWGGRIQLLTGPEAQDPWVWFRIVGGLATGLAVLVVAWRVPRRAVALAVAVTYLGVGLLTWGRSLCVVWTEPNPPGFRVVHTVLAVVTWGFGVAIVWVLARAPRWRVTVGG